MKATNLSKFIAWALALIAVSLSVTSVNAQTRLDPVGPPITRYEFVGGLEGKGFTPTPAVSPVLNRSIKSNISASGNIMSSFVVGQGVKHVAYLIRAVGPGLTAFGVENAMAHPTIKVYRNGQLFVESREWSRVYTYYLQIREYERVTGAFPFEAGSKDAVIASSFPPGTYNVVVSSYSDSETPAQGGEVLLEQYDLPQLSVPNREPTPPTVFGDPTAVSNKPYQVSVVSNDADGDELVYGFDWDNDGVVDQYSSPTNPGVFAAVTKTWTATGVHLFGVSVRDGRSGGYSTVTVKITVTGREE